MKNDERRVIANVITSEGKITDSFYEGDSYTKRTSEQKEYVDTHIINFNKEAEFVKLYDDIVPLLKERLTPTEFIFTISLSPYVCYEDCILRTNGRHNGKIMNAKDLSEKLNIDDSNTRRIISSLKKKGVIGQHETGEIIDNDNYKIKKVYTANPYIFFRGTNINKTVESFYKNSGWNIFRADIEEV